MLRASCFWCLFFCCCFQLYASDVIRRDSLTKLLIYDNKNLRQQELVKYLHSFFNEVPLDDFMTAKAGTDELFTKYQLKSRPALDYFIESIYQSRKLHYDDAENLMRQAINLAQKAGDHYLTYSFFLNLGFLQTVSGNTTGAVSSFRVAKKEAILLNDAKLQVIIDINISDLYYRNNFYAQSLFYTTQADSILAHSNIKEQRLNNAVNSNKAESYFRMGDLNGLKEVDRALYHSPGNDRQIYTFRKRADYYILLLEQSYKNAVQEINRLKKDKYFLYNNADEQCLADAYYEEGGLDSAKAIVNRLLADTQQGNHPEVKFHLYAVLGEIAQKQNDFKQAALNFKLALQESEKNINRLTSVGYISSEIKADELEGFFVKREMGYRNERTWLTILVVVAVLALIVGAMFYSNIRQKRYYEKLLFTAQKEEL